MERGAERAGPGPPPPPLRAPTSGAGRRQKLKKRFAVRAALRPRGAPRNFLDASDSEESLSAVGMRGGESRSRSTSNTGSDLRRGPPSRNQKTDARSRRQSDLAARHGIRPQRFPIVAPRVGENSACGGKILRSAIFNKFILAALVK